MAILCRQFFAEEQYPLNRIGSQPFSEYQQKEFWGPMWSSAGEYPLEGGCCIHFFGFLGTHRGRSKHGETKGRHRGTDSRYDHADSRDNWTAWTLGDDRLQVDFTPQNQALVRWMWEGTRATSLPRGKELSFKFIIRA